mgnify:CR=1 FL=1
MGLTGVFTYHLTETQKKEILIFLGHKENATIYQYPGWQEMITPQKKSCYFLGYNNNILSSVAVIAEQFRTGSISFGPVSEEADNIIDSILQIKDFYKRKKFGLLRVQLESPVCQKTAYIEYKLRNRIFYRQKLDRFNWSTSIVDLSPDIDALFKSFSENHKRSIKKAQKNEIYACPITDINQIYALSDIYTSMHKQKRVAKPFPETRKVFQNVFEYFNKHDKGVFIGSFNKEGQLLGGIMLVFQGNTVIYFYGASVKSCPLPVLHLAFWEAIKLCKERGIRYFDLGGYNHLVAEKDQISQINRFKRGFRGEYVFYPRLMYIRLNSILYALIMLIRPFYLKFRT